MISVWDARLGWVAAQCGLPTEAVIALAFAVQQPGWSLGIWAHFTGRPPEVIAAAIHTLDASGMLHIICTPVMESRSQPMRSEQERSTQARAAARDRQRRHRQRLYDSRDARDRPHFDFSSDPPLPVADKTDQDVTRDTRDGDTNPQRTATSGPAGIIDQGLPPDLPHSGDRDTRDTRDTRDGPRPPAPAPAQVIRIVHHRHKGLTPAVPQSTTPLPAARSRSAARCGSSAQVAPPLGPTAEPHQKVRSAIRLQ